MKNVLCLPTVLRTYLLGGGWCEHGGGGNSNNNKGILIPWIHPDLSCPCNLLGTFIFGVPRFCWNRDGWCCWTRGSSRNGRNGHKTNKSIWILLSTCNIQTTIIHQQILTVTSNKRTPSCELFHTLPQLPEQPAQGQMPLPQQPYAKDLKIKQWVAARCDD